MIKELIQKTEEKFITAIDFYKKDIAVIRTGRASHALVENIMIDCYGQKMSLKELGSITIPEPRMILIQPWDKGAVDPIYQALRKAEIGINPVVDGQAIRLVLPQLTEERRKEFVKILNRKTEDTRIGIRQIREHALGEFHTLEKSGQVREDERFKFKEDLQKTVDKYNDLIKQLEQKKENELLSS